MKLALALAMLFFSSIQGGVEGLITGDADAPLARVTVGVDGLAAGEHRQVVSDSAGHYLLDELRPGGYSLWAEAKGYGCIIYPKVAVFPGKRIRQDFHFSNVKQKSHACPVKG